MAAPTLGEGELLLLKVDTSLRLRAVVAVELPQLLSDVEALGVREAAGVREARAVGGGGAVALCEAEGGGVAGSVMAAEAVASTVAVAPPPAGDAVPAPVAAALLEARGEEDADSDCTPRAEAEDEKSPVGVGAVVAVFRGVGVPMNGVIEGRAGEGEEEVVAAPPGLVVAAVEAHGLAVPPLLAVPIAVGGGVADGEEAVEAEPEA